MWVADIVDGVVKRLDPKTGRTTAHYRTASGPCGMAYGAGSVWVEDYNGNAVTRIDVATGKLHNYPVGTSPYDVAFLAGAAWVTNYGDNTVSRVDAQTGKTTTIKVGGLPQGIAPAAGALWVADAGASAITRIDATTHKTTTIPFHGLPAWTAFDADTVWIGDQTNGEIVEVDARTAKIVRRSKVGSMPNDGDAYDGAVWFPDKGGSLYRLDEQTHQVTGPFELGAGNPFVLDGYDGKLWIADYGGTEHHRGRPGEVAVALTRGWPTAGAGRNLAAPWQTSRSSDCSARSCARCAAAGCRARSAWCRPACRSC